MPEKQKNRYANSVRIVGYLKENNLETVTNTRGDQVIRGALVIATTKTSSYKVQFYVAAMTSANEPSQDYERLSALLPANTTTVASILKADSNADFDSAIANATKVWVMARLDEYASRSGERETSMITIKGFRGGIASEDKFRPCAEFEADVYIETLAEEVNGANEKTGRLSLGCVVPKYKEIMDRIDFIAGTEGNAAQFIASHWKVGDTVHIGGDLVNLQERVLVESETPSEGFGRLTEPQYETRFVRERVITTGGPCKCDPITKAMVKEGLAQRELLMQKNGARAKQSPNANANISAAPAKADLSEMDF